MNSIDSKNNINNNIFPDYPYISDEIALEVFKYLEPKDLGSFCLVNKEWNIILEDRSIWIQFIPNNTKKNNPKDCFKDRKNLEVSLKNKSYSIIKTDNFLDVFSTNKEIPSRTDESFPNYPSVPQEIAIHIFDFLSPSELAKLKLVNTNWKILAEDSSLWQKFLPKLYPTTLLAERALKKLTKKKKTSEINPSLIANENFIAFVYEEKKDIILKIMFFKDKTEISFKIDEIDNREFFQPIEIKNYGDILAVYDSDQQTVKLFDIKQKEKLKKFKINNEQEKLEFSNMNENEIFFCSKENVFVYNWKDSSFVAKFTPYSKDEYSQNFPIRVIKAERNLIITGTPEESKRLKTNRNIKIFNSLNYESILSYEDLILFSSKNNKLYGYNKENKIVFIDLEKIQSFLNSNLDFNNNQIVEFNIVDDYIISFNNETRKIDIRQLENQKFIGSLSGPSHSNCGQGYNVEFIDNKLIFYTANEIYTYNFSDKKIPSMVKQALRDAEKDGISTIENIKNYGINKVSSLQKIAMAASKQSDISLDEIYFIILEKYMDSNPRFAIDLADEFQYSKFRILNKNIKFDPTLFETIPYGELFILSAKKGYWNFTNHLIKNSTFLYLINTLHYKNYEWNDYVKIVLESKNYINALKLYKLITEEYKANEICDYKLLKQIINEFLTSLKNLNDAYEFFELFDNVMIKINISEIRDLILSCSLNLDDKEKLLDHIINLCHSH